VSAVRRKRPGTGLAAVLAVLLLALAGCGSSGGGDGAAVTGIKVSDDDGYRGILLDKPYAVPAVSLTDTSGKPFSIADQAKRTLVFFGYTHCPDICQVVMSTIASAVVRLPTSEQKALQVVFVTTDPARDTKAVLRTYLDRFNPAFVGVTGSLDRIDALGHGMGIEVKKGQKLPDGGYEVTHTTNVTDVEAGKGDLIWTASTSPSDMATDLHKIIGASS
jgi:protein SCO1/2